MKTSLPSFIISIGLLGLLVVVILQIPTDSPRLAETAEAHLDESGVKNPVTAVLLNYRSYDTLLEMAVLLLALCSTWAVGQSKGLPKMASDTPLSIITSFFVPLIIIGSAYYLWVGAYDPGGAFQGGALLAGGFILMVIAGRAGWMKREWVHRSVLAFGLLVFVVLAALPLFGGRALLEYPKAQAKHWILTIESAAMLSIAFTLTALMLGGRPTIEAEHGEKSSS